MAEKTPLTSNSHSPSDPPSTLQQDEGAVIFARRMRNFLIVAVGMVLSVAVFLGLHTQTTAVSLPALAENSVPLEVALKNGKPTLMEFYANWCTSCQAMAPDINALEEEYGDRVNFVMLNVDNTKWLPEILAYRVDGIPHFVFLDQQGEAIAQSIGEQPRSILSQNLESLVAGLPLNTTQSEGQTSAFSASVNPQGQSDPRSHGAQVVN